MKPDWFDATFAPAERTASPATAAQLDAVADLCGHALPADYADFLRLVGGFNGDLPSGRYVRLFTAAEVAADSFDLDEIAGVDPETTVVIGDTGASWLFVLDAATVEYTEIDPGAGETLRHLGTSFTGFIAAVQQ